MKYLIPLIVVFLVACAPNYSDGSRVGVVTKLSNKGLFFKSWEGEMNMGGIRQGHDEDGNPQAMLNVFDFNVDPSAVEKVKAAQASGKRVELVYRQWFLKPPSIDHLHVIVDVREPRS